MVKQLSIIALTKIKTTQPPTITNFHTRAFASATED
jgi:hypothetical protein